MTRSNICIVLVEPHGPLNIGSVCRAMLNFGFTDLRLVSPTPKYQNDDARRMAVKATNILESASLYNNLEEAISDCHFTLGTTRRFGKYRKDFFNPDQAAEHLLKLADAEKIALIFGREDHGLSKKELELCQRLITIPTQDIFPSMNLAQSVTVCLYEINKILSAPASSTSQKKLVSVERLEAMLQHMRKTLLDVEYLDPQNPDHILRTFRQIFGRAELQERDVKILQGLWSRIDWLEGERRKLSK